MDNSRESDRPVSVQVDEEYPIPPVVMEASTTSPSVNVSGIEDRFYENETNIVAVFDVDDDTVLQFQKNVAINWTFRSIGLLIVAFLYELIESHRLATIFMIIGILVTAFALNGWKDVRTAHRNLLGGGIHMAITTVSVRYDQPNPMISTEVSKRNE